MAVANIINLVKNQWTLKAHIWLGINNLCLITWISVFNVGNDPAVFACSFILIFTVVVALKFWDAVGEIKEFNWFTYFTRNSYAFYLGWIIAASNLNFGMMIVYWWEGSYLDQLITFWVMAPLCAVGATVLNAVREGKKGVLSCACLWISVIWAFTGAAIRSNICLSDPSSCYPS